jgi:undecaprenyl-diphosphatase
MEARMALYMGIGTVPAAIAGLLLAGWIADNLRSPVVVAATLSGYGILLALADRYGRQARNISEVRFSDALVIGVAQALALVPGTSRSGVTITAGMVLGLRRQDAARFSFLLSVPVILLATLYELATVFTSNVPMDWVQLGVAALISGIVAYLSIDFFMRFVNANSLLPFAIYRVILASVILYVLL